MYNRLFPAVACVMLMSCGGGSASDPPQGPVVFMGDSITAYWDTGAPGDPITVPTLMERLPGAIDAGVAGITSVQMLAMFQASVLALHPSVVVIDGGANDLGLLPDANIDSVAQMASEASSAGARVIIGTVIPGEFWNYSQILTQADTIPKIEAFDAQLRVLAASYGYGIADYYPVMLNPDGTQNLSLYDPDAVHPNSAGYAAMWGALEPALIAAGVHVPTL